MKITYDTAKNETNIAERGLSFERTVELDWESAITWRDVRRDYGEVRYCGLALLGRRLYAVTFTLRGDVMRIISFRKANNREGKKYEKEKA